jgi:hypothetical protein
VILLLVCVTLVMLACLLVQGATIAIATRRTASVLRRPLRRRTPVGGFVLIAEIMLLLVVGIVVQITLWAIFYRFLDIIATIDTFEKALYFSGVTFTSLGYGDVVLPPGYRLLAVLEAATGLLMFGITTAVMVTVLESSRKFLGNDSDADG